MLADDARILNFTHFSRVLAYWTQQADADGSEGKAKDNFERRSAHLSRLAGMWFGDQIFDPISGEIVSNERKGARRSCSKLTGPRPRNDSATRSRSLTCAARPLGAGSRVVRDGSSVSHRSR